MFTHQTIQLRCLKQLWNHISYTLFLLFYIYNHDNMYMNMLWSLQIQYQVVTGGLIQPRKINIISVFCVLK